MVCCGAVAPALVEDMGQAICPAGNLQGELVARPQYHIFVSSQAKGDRMRAAVEATGRQYGLPIRGMGEGSIFVFHVAREPIRDYRTLQAYADRAFHQKFGAELIRNGIFVYPGQKNYISLAHTDADLDRTLEVYDAAFRTLTGKA